MFDFVVMVFFIRGRRGTGPEGASSPYHERRGLGCVAGCCRPGSYVRETGPDPFGFRPRRRRGTGPQSRAAGAGPMRNSEFGIVHPSSDPRGSAGRMQAVPAGTVVYVPAIRTLCQANAECGMWNSELSPDIDPSTGNRELATDNRELFTPDWVMVLGGRTHLTRIWVRCIRPPDPDGSGFLSVKLCS